MQTLRQDCCGDGRNGGVAAEPVRCDVAQTPSRHWHLVGQSRVEFCSEDRKLPFHTPERIKGISHLGAF
jgi:hypothetical protein